MTIPKPTLLPVPFAENGARNTIPAEQPTAPGETNHASWKTGFPPVTMMPLEAGGIPPEGMDFNGILHAISSNVTHWNAGGQMRFDSDFCTAIGGYPKGAVLQSDDGEKSFVSLKDENTVNFNEVDDYKTSWALWAGKGGMGSGILFCTATGTADAITADLEELPELTDGVIVSFRAVNANTTTTPTFCPNELEAKTIVKGANKPLVAGDIGGTGYLTLLQYSAIWDEWVLLNPAKGVDIVIPIPMPIGAIYVQFANQTDPTTLFGGTWQNISSTYAGRFFRAEGGLAAAFGSVQAGGAPNSSTYIGRIEYSTSSPPHSVSSVLNSKTYTDADYVGDSLGHVRADISKGSAIYGAATEVRPVNSTIRIWKRTA